MRNDLKALDILYKRYKEKSDEARKKLKNLNNYLTLLDISPLLQQKTISQKHVLKILKLIKEIVK